jgi:hypothetical protein
MTVADVVLRGYALERAPRHHARSWYVTWRGVIVARVTSLPAALAELIAWAAL